MELLEDYAESGGIARGIMLAVAPGAGRATSGDFGKAIVGDNGYATTGANGYAICGIGGSARGGVNAVLRFTTADGAMIEKRVSKGEAYRFFTLHHGQPCLLHDVPSA